jgi:hypothetical protein
VVSVRRYRRRLSRGSEGGRQEPNDGLHARFRALCWPLPNSSDTAAAFVDDKTEPARISPFGIGFSKPGA